MTTKELSDEEITDVELIKFYSERIAYHEHVNRPSSPGLIELYKEKISELINRSGNSTV